MAGLAGQGRGAIDVLRLSELLLPSSAPWPLAASTGEGTCVLLVTLALLLGALSNRGTCTLGLPRTRGRNTTALPKSWAVLPKPYPSEARLLFQDGLFTEAGLAGLQ